MYYRYYCYTAIDLQYVSIVHVVGQYGSTVPYTVICDSTQLGRRASSPMFGMLRCPAGHRNMIELGRPCLHAAACWVGRLACRPSSDCMFQSSQGCLLDLPVQLWEDLARSQNSSTVITHLSNNSQFSFCKSTGICMQHTDSPALPPAQAARLQRRPH